MNVKRAAIFKKSVIGYSQPHYIFLGSWGSVSSHLKALLIGCSYHLLWNMTRLLVRAGFTVDVVAFNTLIASYPVIRAFTYVSSKEALISELQLRLKQDYNWMIVTEDQLLQDILNSSLTTAEKLKILPVRKEEKFTHLYSKIGLSKLFTQKGVQTPSFFVASTLQEAISNAQQLGYPLLAKLDSCGGGFGVFECNAPHDFYAIGHIFDGKPILIQKKIIGRELDLSAIYLQEELVHFNYARPQKHCGHRFGISSLRTYHSLNIVEEEIFDELAHIGHVLGAHGCVNIACIEQADGKRFYFEADMRPNLWVEMPRFLGEDPALRIQEWFKSRKKIAYPLPVVKHAQMQIPYFSRLKLWELFLNRYRVWSYIPIEDWKFIARIIHRKTSTYRKISSKNSPGKLRCKQACFID